MLRGGFGLIGRLGYLAARHSHTILFQDAFGLVLMNLHNDSIPDRQDHACGVLLRQQTLDFISKPGDGAPALRLFRSSG
jgi:hypothetical protein